jgi:tetratricopeptide (TPR) repeat protein
MSPIRKAVIPLLSVLIILCLPIAAVKPAHALETSIQSYLDGLGFKEKGQYEEAVAAFGKAIKADGKEKKNVRFYGMRYGEYFPHREKGICHYHLKQYAKAVEELEISISQLPNAEAKKYLEMAKAEMGGRPGGGAEAVAEVIETPPELQKLKKARQENTSAIAVVIGNRDYKNRDIPPVDYAIRDASLMKEALTTSLGYREGNIIYETNATKGTLESIFGTAGNPRGRLSDLVAPQKSDIFVYYSGHGAPNLENRRGYLLPADGDPNVIDISGYPLDVLYRNLASLKARSVTVVTDACFSGAPLFKKASPVGIVVENPLIAMKNAYIINSSSGTELSSWYPEKGHGLFTYYFLLGLTGPADKNGDGKITLGEMHDYLDDQVPYMSRKLHSGRKQTPTFTVQDSSKVLVTYR